MTRIHVFGGTGYAGGNIVALAASRGHETTSVSRSLPVHRCEGVDYTTGSILDGQVRARTLAHCDVVVVAVAPFGDMAGSLEPGVEALAADADRAAVRIGVVGGVGSLLMSAAGPRLVDAPGFPAAIRTASLEMAAVLDGLRGAPTSLDWFCLCPPTGFRKHAPGQVRGSYRVGGDVLLTDDEGTSFIGGVDFGAAVVDEIERPAHRRACFTVAY